jgi:predicted MPP superfamily phosphohydrolase
VAQLSDIHVGRRTPPARIKAALDAVNAFQPDLVVLTGDYLSHNQQGVGLLQEALGGLAAPTVAVLGNHDHWVDAAGATAALEGLGYAVLRNQHTVLRLRGVPFTVIGVDDLVTGHADPARALAGAPGGSRLVLAHAPRTADLLRDAGTPLVVLSGHTHGGQISIPILTPLLATLVAREPYLRGFFRLGAVRLYVNRGVGNTVTTVRLNSDPEVTSATLRLVEA